MAKRKTRSVRGTMTYMKRPFTLSYRESKPTVFKLQMVRGSVIGGEEVIAYAAQASSCMKVVVSKLHSRQHLQAKPRMVPTCSASLATPRRVCGGMARTSTTWRLARLPTCQRGHKRDVPFSLNHCNNKPQGKMFK